MRVSFGQLGYLSGAGQRVAQAATGAALRIDDLFFPAKLNAAVLSSAQGRGAEAETLLHDLIAAYLETGRALLAGLTVPAPQRCAERQPYGRG